MAQPDTTTRDAPTETTTATRDDTPGPGTLGALRRAKELEASKPAATGTAWRVFAVIVVIALAIAIGYLIGSGDDGTAIGAPSNADEAGTLQAEKAQLAAGSTVVAAAPVPDNADEPGALQAEKDELVAGSGAVAGDTVPNNTDEAATLQDEKVALGDGGQETSVPGAADEAAAIADEKATIAGRGDAGTPLTAHGEKDVLLAR